jgi:tetratricopeptide (TPR) repeat protein
MEKELQSAATSPSGELSVLGFRIGLACARGQVRQAQEFAHQAEEALDRLHLQGRASMEAQLASFEALVGDHADAENAASEALRISRILPVLGSAATTFAILRQDKKALALADEIQQAHPNHTVTVNVTVPLIRATAALRPANPANTDPAKAIDFLNAAAVYARDSAGIFYVRGIAYEKAGRYAEAQQDFQKVLEIKSHSGPDLVFAVNQLEMARVFQKQGDIPKARIAYQDFLVAWKNADPDVPLLQVAKAEYAKLQ